MIWCEQIIIFNTRLYLVFYLTLFIKSVYGQYGIYEVCGIVVTQLIEKFQRNVFSDVDNHLKMYSFMFEKYGKKPFSKKK